MTAEVLQDQSKVAQTLGQRRERERAPRTEVRFGYCDPFTDFDQTAAYCIQRMAGLIDDNAHIEFAPKDIAETDYVNADIAVFEGGRKSTRDSTMGNFAHEQLSDDRLIAYRELFPQDRTAALAEKLEICATMSAFLNAEAELRSKLSAEQFGAISKFAAYLQDGELGKRARGKPQGHETIQRLYQGAQLAHYAHEALGTSKTNPQAGLEACYQLTKYVIESGTNIGRGVDINRIGDPELAQDARHYQEILSREEAYDSKVLADLKPEIFVTPTKVNIATLDVRGGRFIMPKNAFAKTYESGADLAVVISEDVDTEGKPISTVVKIGVNTRQGATVEKGLDLDQLWAELNNLEYVEGLRETLNVEANLWGGHQAKSAEGELRFTFLGSPQQTGTAIKDPFKIVGVIEELYSRERYSGEELQKIGALLDLTNYPHRTVSVVPSEHPYSYLREHAIVATPAEFVHDEQFQKVIRMSDLEVRRDQAGNIEGARLLTNREKRQRSEALFEQLAKSHPRKTLEELARGNIQIEDYLDRTEFLMDLVESVSQDERSIDMLYNPANDALDLPQSNLLEWARGQQQSMAVVKFNHHDSASYKVDSQIMGALFQHAATSRDGQFQERFTESLARILRSKTYASAYDVAEQYDHILMDVLHVALNRQRTDTHVQQLPSLNSLAEAGFNERPQQIARESLGQLTDSQKRHLCAYARRATAPNETDLRSKIAAILGIDSVEARSDIDEAKAYRVETKDLLRPGLAHVAVLIGRQRSNDGQDILAYVESEVGEADVALRAGFLAQPEIPEAVSEMVRQLETQARLLLEHLPDGQNGEMRVTIAGPQELPVNFGIWYARNKAKLDEEYGKDRLKVTLYKFANGKYVPMTIID